MWQKLIIWCSGRTTMFAIYFTISGTILQLFHKLDPNFIMLIGAVQSLVLAHSVKEDWFASKLPQSQDKKDQDKKDEVVVDSGADRGDTK